jgi:hypothetical protein
MADVGYSGKPLIDKLGIAAGDRVAVIGVDDPHFDRQLRARTDDVSRGRPRKDTRAIVCGVTKIAQLDRLMKLTETIIRDGMIWVVWPKGRRELTETHVRAAALAQGLVDVKVCAFSETLSALKLVIPKAKR